MTPEERIDANIDSLLKAAGASSLKNYMQLSKDRMREAMRKIMADLYIAGSDGAHKAMEQSGPLASLRDRQIEAFVAGARWWEYYSTSGSMWQSDQALAFEEAQKRYPDDKKEPK